MPVDPLRSRPGEANGQGFANIIVIIVVVLFLWAGGYIAVKKGVINLPGVKQEEPKEEMKKDDTSTSYRQKSR